MDKLRMKLEKLQEVVSRLDKFQKDIKDEEWDPGTVKVLKETIQLVMDLTEELLRFMEEGTDEILNSLNEFQIKNDNHEARLQQLEDKSMRAMDFIHEHGLYEQFRRYYEKKKQTNLVLFPQKDQ